MATINPEIQGLYENVVIQLDNTELRIASSLNLLTECKETTEPVKASELVARIVREVSRNYPYYYVRRRNIF
ncbi:MAG TPA: hypothetical protein VLG12_03740 [Candidatus Saccharimonadales bacterium]|nr:hypothetical protein [Candidatus Saccharimonadales bacterium]